MTCGECMCYVTDEKEGKLLPKWVHSEDESAFCVMQDLFTTVFKNDNACKDFIKNK